MKRVIRTNMKRAALTHVVTVVFFALAFAGMSVPAQAVLCGFTIQPGTTFTMIADLDCTELVQGAAAEFTVLGPNATLDMAGHKIICEASTGFVDGIHLDGSGATLKNGAVVGVCETGVVVEGTGSHNVLNIVTQSIVGFQIDSDNNTIAQSAAVIGGAGYVVNGSSNELDNDSASDNSRRGFVITGGKNVVKGSVATQNALFPVECQVNGFEISGPNNRFSNNISSGNGGAGFNINPGSEHNLFRGNIAIGNQTIFTCSKALLGEGFQIAGSENTFDGNSAIKNSGEGFNVVSGTTLNEFTNNTSTRNSDGIVLLNNTTFNVVTSNRVYANEEDGIIVIGTNNFIAGNFILDNFTLDALDANTSCVNTWQGNLFDTAQSGGGTGNPCIH